jgi:hypothetical protein
MSPVMEHNESQHFKTSNDTSNDNKTSSSNRNYDHYW